MRCLVALCLALLVPSIALAEGPDPAYLKAFGPGSIAASGLGYPAFEKYDAAQFLYKDGKFVVVADGTLDLRAFTPKGVTLGKAMAKVRKERGANLKYMQAEYMSFRIWASHDSSGQDQTKGKWPAKLGDEPVWTPLTDTRFDLPTSSYDWESAGAGWEDLKADLWSMAKAKPGQKYYVVFSVGYRYKTPGGEMESKWDSVLGKFVQQKSLGLVGFVYGPALAACTIEIGEGPDQSGSFKDAGEGILDPKTGLTWAKQVGPGLRYLDLPDVDTNPGVVTYLKNKGNGWRLPTVDELLAWRKLGGQTPQAWFNAHGFTGVKNDWYWTSGNEGYRGVWVIHFGDTREKAMTEATDAMQLWMVKGP
jgi:hypothetical protein